jgi:hypothetical protein
VCGDGGEENQFRSGKGQASLNQTRRLRVASSKTHAAGAAPRSDRELIAMPS